MIVYGLVDKANPNVVRYVGFTTSPRRRLEQHRTLRGCSNSGLREWVLGMRVEGRSPAMTVLARVGPRNWRTVERDEIARRRALPDCQLLNVLDGGDGDPLKNARPRGRRRSGRMAKIPKAKPGGRRVRKAAKKLAEMRRAVAPLFLKHPTLFPRL